MLPRGLGLEQEPRKGLEVHLLQQIVFPLRGIHQRHVNKCRAKELGCLHSAGFYWSSGQVNCWYRQDYVGFLPRHLMQICLMCRKPTMVVNQNHSRCYIRVKSSSLRADPHAPSLLIPAPEMSPDLGHCGLVLLQEYVVGS